MRRGALIVILAVVVAGCGGGSSTSVTTARTPPEPNQLTKSVTVRVGDHARTGIEHFAEMYATAARNAQWNRIAELSAGPLRQLAQDMKRSHANTSGTLVEKPPVVLVFGPWGTVRQITTTGRNSARVDFTGREYLKLKMTPAGWRATYAMLTPP
jgi:hypothetical protein